MLNCSARFSAVSGIESIPKSSSIFGLMNRQPMVVSSILFCLEKAEVAFPITNGARLILSTPPAIIRDCSPDLMALEAQDTASIPEPQSRLRVAPGTVSGIPDSSRAIRATLRLSSPAWFAHPRITSSIDVGFIPGFLSNKDRIGIEARSSVRIDERAPP